VLAPPGPELAPARTFAVPVVPRDNCAAARQVADALRHAADEVETAQRLGHAVLEDTHRQWTGSSASASCHPLDDLDGKTRLVARTLREAAEQLDRYAHALAKAKAQHSWSWGKILTVAAVVVVTTTVVVVTVGAAAPAAAAADAAIVEGEVAATAAAAAAAAGAAADAAEALTAAVRALRAVRAVATFLRPQVVQTALFTDVEAYGQVRDTGHLDIGALIGDAAVGVVSGHYGGRMAGASEQLFGKQVADPVARWLLPKLGTGLGWGASDAATQVAMGGDVDPLEVGGTVVIATRGGAAFSRLHVRAERRAGMAFGPWPPERVPASVPALLDHLAQHNGAPPPGYKGGKVYENNTSVLPDGEYREYDLHAKVKAAPGVKGIPRNQQRLLVDGRSGSVFFTDSHYMKGFRRVR